MTGAQATVVSRPPRRWGADADPVLIPDPDVLVLDEGFRPLLVGNAIVERAWTGGDWLEGPAWSAVGRFLVFSDTRRNRQYRWLWETGGVSVFREPSHHGNGNCFDAEGRLVVCEHFNRRVVRFGHDGLVRVLADNCEGRPLNSPNDAAAHPRDGSLWFTDPPYGTTLAEGRPDEPGGPTNPDGRLHPRVGAELAGAFGGGHRQPAGVYRWDPGSGRTERVLGEDELAMPNGLAFSPDGRTLYVSSTEQGPGAPPPPAGSKAVHAYDVDGARLRNGRVLSDMVVDGAPCPPDGIKADVHGHLWCACSGPLGHAGVVVLDPAGKPVCRVRLPEARAPTSASAGRAGTCCSSPRRARSTACRSTRRARRRADAPSPAGMRLRSRSGPNSRLQAALRCSRPASGLTPARTAAEKNDRPKGRARIPHGVAVVAALVSINILGEMVSIGTLLAFVLVCGSVVYLRRSDAEVFRPFRVPGVPWVPLFGILSCLVLMIGLPLDTWLRLVVWLAIGLAIYFFYGRSHSALRQPRTDRPEPRPS